MKQQLQSLLMTMLAMVFSTVLAFGQLSGNYTIDPSGSGTSNYTSFTNAVSALTTNGANGNVTFTVASGTFSENISIGAFTGSGSYSITFKGAGKSSTKITSSSSSGTVRLNAGDNITFRDMEIQNTANKVVNITSTSDDCSFINCALTGYSISSSSNTYSVVYCGSQQARRLKIDSCDIKNGSYGLYIYGPSSSNKLDNFTLSNSKITDFYYRGLHLYYSEGTQILNNYFESNGSYSSAYYLYFYYIYGVSGTPARVSGNELVNPTYGMYTYYGQGYSSSQPNEIFNNVISTKSGINNYYRIYFSSYCKDWKIYHNTIASNYTSAVTSYGCISATSSTSSGFDIKNNTLISSGGYYLYMSGTETEDYNNMYGWGGASGSYSNGGSSTPGSNSVSTDQGWASLSDLNITDGCVNGVNLTSTVSTDIKGKTRSNPPDIGAYEASLGTNDAGVSEIISPVTPLSSGTQTVQVKVRNFGSNAINSVTLNYKVGSGSTVSQTFTLSSALSVCSETTLSFTTGFSTPSGCSDFSVWTSSPNSSTDPNNANDTMKSKIGSGVSGTFSVGGSGADYNTIADAMNAIYCGGVSGPVTFNINAGTYTGQVVINSVPGTSSTNTITFAGAGKGSTILTHSVSNSTDDAATLLLDGGQHFVFRDMTIRTTSANYGRAVQLFSGSNVAFRNCALEASTTGTSSYLHGLTISGDKTYYAYSATSYSNVTVDSCTFEGGYAGIFTYGANTNTIKNVTVTNCEFTQQRYYGAYFYMTDKFNVSNNTIHNMTYAYQYTYGMYFSNGYYNSGYYSAAEGPNTVSGNNITAYGYGMYMFGTNNSQMQPGVCSNNIVLSELGLYGMYWYSYYPNNNWNIYHNTSSCGGSGSGTRYAFYYQTNSSAADTFNIRNNIFDISSGGGYPAYFSGTTPNGTVRVLDYNDYYNSGGSNLLYMNGTNVDASTLTTYGNSTGTDTNSINVMPPFKSSSDLHLSDACFEKGTGISSVTFDIDGDGRSPVAPHLGADEVPQGSLDIGVTALISPNGSLTSGTQTVKVEVSNFGLTAIDSFMMHYQVGTGTIVSQSVPLTTALANCKMDTFTFSTTFSWTLGCSEIRAWTSMPNGSADDIAKNDSSNSIAFGVGLSGTYTVGSTSGNDFSDLSDAFDKLNCAGLNGPTVLLLDSATYTGQMVIGSFNGASPTNTLTIDGGGKVTLTHNVTGYADDQATLVFNNAEHTIFRNMTINVTNANYGWGVGFFGNSKGCGLNNCTINLPSTSTSSYHNGIVASGSKSNTYTASSSSDITIDSCVINGGYYGIYFYGDGASPLAGTSISNTTISGPYYYGAYFYHNDGLQFTNNAIEGIRYYFGYGLYLYSGYYNSGYYSSNTKGVNISGNNIVSDIRYGMYLYGVMNSSTDRGLLANNSIALGGITTTQYGVYTYSFYPMDFWDVLNNSMNLYGSSSQVRYGFYNYYYSGRGGYRMTFKNNIWAITGTGSSSSRAYYSSYGPDATDMKLDHNCYYNNASTTLAYSGANVFASNVNSYDTDGDSSAFTQMPPFKSDTDLHLNDACWPRGASLSQITMDIDGDARSASGPHVGSDEVPTANVDAGIAEILSPVGGVTSGTQTVQVVVRNYGLTSLTAVDINYQVGSATAVNQSVSFSPSLASCNQDTLTFTTTFNHTSGCGSLRAWTSNPNATTDGLAVNDTAGPVAFGVSASGTFTVGGSSPDFTDLNAALTFLKCTGLGGAVTLNLRSGTYNGQVDINGIGGLSSANTLTIQSDPSNSTMPVLKYASTDATDNFVVNFNGVSYVTLKGIKVENTGTSGFSHVIEFAGTTDFITIDGCELQGTTVSSTSNNDAVVFDYTGGFVENVTIKNSKIKNGSYGVHFYGTSTATLQSNWTIDNCKITDFYYMGVYSFYNKELTITNTTISTGDNSYSTPYGIYMYYTDGANVITGNRIAITKGGYGIFQYYCDASTSSPALIANNFVSVGDGSNWCRSIYTYYSSYQHFYNNSALSYPSSSYLSYSYATLTSLYTSTSYAGNEFKNNSLYNMGGGFAFSAYSSTYTRIASDNNNFYNGSGGKDMIMANTTAYSSLASYVSAVSTYSLDANSVSADPVYTSFKDLHAASSVLDSAGVSLTSVTVDIDGDSRRNPSPSIGADEYTAIDNDGGITDILSPNIICTSNDAVVRIKNLGNLSLTSATINWTIDGTSQTPYSWTSSTGLIQGGSEVVNLGTFSAPSGSGPVQIVAWTTNPNGYAEIKTSNDTSSTSVGRGMSGTYSIAASGGDYPSFSDAVSDLHMRGICGPVVFNVEEGTYNENITINEIVNSSPTNTVTFQADANNTADVNLNYSILGYADNFIVKLNGASNIVFDGINMENTGSNSTYTNIVTTYRPGSNIVSNITIKNATLKGSVAGTTSSAAAIVNLYAFNYATYPNYNKHRNIMLENLDLVNGSYGVYSYGTSTSFNENEHIGINNCDISGSYYMGLYLYYSDTCALHNNTIMPSASGYSSSQFGMYLYFSDGGNKISGNTIEMAGAPTSQNVAFYMLYNNAGSDSTEITNNFFSCSNTSASVSTGLDVRYSNHVNIIHNNCNVESGAANSNNGAGALVLATSSSYGPYKLYNNIFRSNVSGGLSLFGYANILGSNYMSDHNNLDGDNHVYGTTGYSSLSDYQSASGLDANSMSVNPFYTSASDLHVNNAKLHEMGTDKDIDKDIDGDTRDLPPTVGAHEINPNVSVLAVSADTVCGHDRAAGTVKMTLRNDGDIALNEISVSFSVDGGTPVNDVIPGPLAVGATQTFTLTEKAAFAGMNDYSLKAWSNDPDEDRSGDTASTSIPYWPYPVSSFTNADSCFGDAMVFTNTSMVSSGTIVSSAWDFDDMSTSTDKNPTHKYAASGAYDVALTSTSNNGCIGKTTMEVRVMTDLMPGSIAGTQTICYDFAPTTFTSSADASMSAGSYEYQWQMSSDDVNFTDISGATSNTYSSGDLTSTTYFRRAVSTSIGCGPKYSNSIKVTVYDMLVAGTVGSDQKICYNTAPATITQSSAPTGGDGTFTYQWERSQDLTTWITLPGATNASVSVGNLTKTTYYRRTDKGGSNCGSVETNIVKITVYDPVNGGIVGPDHQSCPNTAPSILGTTTAASGGDGTYTYQWETSTDKLNWTSVSGATGTTYQHGVINKAMYFRRMATSGSGCGSNYSAIATVSMAPVPKPAFTVSNHCFGDVMPLTNLSSISGGSISSQKWTFGDGNVSADESPKHTYKTDGTKTVKLVLTSNIGCIDSISHTVKISNIPTPAMTYLYDCNADSLRFKNATSVNCGTINAFAWDFGDGNTSTLQNPSHKYASYGSYTVKMKIFLPGGFSDSTSRVVTQYAKGTASFTAQDVCFGEDVQFTNTSTNAASYSWDFDDNTLSALSGPKHFYRVIGKYNVKLTATDGNGCKSDATATVTVKVKPVAYFTTDNRCDKDSVPFFNGTTYADSYSWDFGDANTSTAKNPKHVYGSASTYNVTLYAFNNNGCKDTTDNSVKVYTLPSASFAANSPCEGTATQFTNSSTVVNKNNWTFGDGQTGTQREPSHTYAKAGDYTVSLNIVTTEGCEATASKTVKVYANPVADFSAMDVCLGNATAFTNSSTLSSGTMSYTWDFGDGSNSTDMSPSHTYTAAGTYSVSLKVDAPGSCSSTMTKSVTVKIQPSASFTNNTACEGSATVFSNGSSNATSQLWSFGDGNSSTKFDPSHTYGSAGTYTVTLLSKNASGCESTASASVVVYAMPTAAFSASTECVGNATVFTNTSSISSGTMSYDWDFGDGTSSTNAIPNKTYGSAGTYLALLTVTSNNGCVSAKGVSVKVNARPTASISGTDVCIGSTTNFSNYTTGATKYSWTFGDGNTSNSMSPSNTYKTAGTYTVQMTATNAEGCSDVTSTSVTVYAVPTVSFSQASQCVGTAMSFTNGSSAGNNNWTFGDGYTSTSANPSHTYTMSGNFNVTLKVTNSFGCSSELTKAVTVHAAPTPSFTATTVCRGSATTFSNSSTGATSYAWTFGDGGTSGTQNPSYTYGSAGTYTVTMVATSANGCSSTYASSVVVNATPTASFSVNEACANSAVSFTNTSSAGSNSWTFGDGAGSQMANPSHVYTTANTYNVVLTVTNGDKCVASSNRNVTINPLPVASFTGSALCTGPAAQFTNGTTVPGGSATSAWSFGDGNTSNQTSPSHTYGSAGTYTVRLTATSNKGCVATANNSITVYTAPKADFSAAGVCAGSTTQFNNMSSGAAGSSWNFGDGQTSTDVFPSHKYAGQGNFNVKLIASNAIGCTNEVTKTVSVYAIPTASFTAANGCEGTAMNFSNTSTGASTSTWNYGDGNSSVGTNGMHTYTGSGSRMITLMVESANGCSNETTRTIDVYARPYASFTMSNTCEGDLTKFTNTSQNGSNYAWDFGDAGTSNIESPTHQYTAAGPYTAKLTVMNANCSNVYSMPFTINAAPDAGFSVAKNGRDAKFTANSQVNVSKYEWDFNDGSTSNEANPEHVYQKAVVQTFKVCLKVTDLSGCASESCKDVMVDIVSAKEVEMSGLAIYPNPTKGTIYINLGQNNGKVSIELMDMVGKTVKMVDTSMGGLNFSTDISDMAEGVYLVKVKNGELETTQRIVLSK